MSTPSTNVIELVEKLAGGAPRFDVQGREIAVALYRLLSEGRPVSLEQIGRAVGLPERTVREILDTWPVFFDDQEAVIGFGGLTVAEMPPHRFVVNGRTLYTWCAWDSLFIPGILGQTAAVTSICPATGTEISLEVAPHGVTRVDPPTVVVSFLSPDRKFDQNVITSFCHFIHFFRDPQAGREWVSRHPGTFLLSLEAAFALGRLTNERNFGSVLNEEVGR